MQKNIFLAYSFKKSKNLDRLDPETKDITMKNVNHVSMPTDALKPQFIVDNSGKKTAVILDIKSYETFLEEVEDLYLGMLASQALAEESELISHEIVKKTIKKSDV